MSLTTFVAGSVLTAAQLNGLVDSLQHPIGAILEFKVATNPATLLGYGTWAAYGSGRVTVAIDAGQTEFDTLEETGGAKTHTLSTPEIPAHSHGVSDPGHAHSTGDFGAANASAGGAVNALNGGGSTSTEVTGVTIQNAGGGGAHNNLQPYIVVYRWVRTA